MAEPLKAEPKTVEFCFPELHTSKPQVLSRDCYHYTRFSSPGFLSGESKGMPASWLDTAWDERLTQQRFFSVFKKGSSGRVDMRPEVVGWRPENPPDSAFLNSPGLSTTKSRKYTALWSPGSFSWNSRCHYFILNQSHSQDALPSWESVALSLRGHLIKKSKVPFFSKLFSLSVSGFRNTERSGHTATRPWLFIFEPTESSKHV